MSPSPYKTRLAGLLAVAVLSFLAGCVGGSFKGTGDEPDDPGGEEGDSSVTVSGTVTDYEEGLALPGVTLTTQGLDPALTAVSSETGTYQLAEVPAASAFYITAQPASGAPHVPTIGASVNVLDADVTADLWLVSATFAERQYTSVGMTRQPGTAIVLAELRKPNGQALEGIPAADISLKDGDGNPVGLGPYFVGLSGDVDAALTLSGADASGRARVAFLNVPPGMLSLSVVIPDDQPDPAIPDAGPPGPDAPLPDAGLPDAPLPDAPLPDAALPDAPDAGVTPDGGAEDGGGGGDGLQTVTTPLITAADGATLAVVTKVGGMGSGMGMGMDMDMDMGGTAPVTEPRFSANIYPMLQRVSSGGLGCALCHTAGGLGGGVLILDDGAEVVHARLLLDLRLVNPETPDLSLVLLKPLYEEPPNHPNAFFLDSSNPAYRTIHTWIGQGALP